MRAIETKLICTETADTSESQTVGPYDFSPRSTVFFICSCYAPSASPRAEFRLHQQSKRRLKQYYSIFGRYRRSCN